MTAGPDREKTRSDRALQVPLMRILGAELHDPDDPASGLRLMVTPENVNAVELLHGGAISTVLDVAAYLALLPELADDEEAVTHALFVWYLRPAQIGETLRASAKVVRRGRAVAFVRATLSAGERAYGTAEVTKSIVPISR